MPENKAPNLTPAPSTGAGVNQEDYERVIDDERFREILDDCMGKCIAENGCDNIECEKRCFFRVCFRVAWVLYHAWYVDSVDSAATSPSPAT